ncbi:MAG: carboxymuconolactone decarboxylase family protein [Bacteroidota bacterium]
MDAYFSYLDADSDIKDIILKDNARFQSLSLFSEKVLRGKSEFSVAERETMSAFVSALNRCTYCHNTHLEVAKRFGVDGTLIESLLADVDTAPVSEQMKPVYRYIKKLTLSPSKMVQADAGSVFAVGWSEQALTDAVCVCALFNLYNRLLDGHGIKGSPQSYEGGANHLAKRGYKTGWIPAMLYRLGWLK